MPRRPPFVLAAASAAIAIAVGGCGAGGGGSTPDNPKDELSSAVGNLAHSDALTAALKLETTAETLQGFARESGDKLSAADAEAIATAQFVIETKTADGQDLADVKPGDKNAANVAF